MLNYNTRTQESSAVLQKYYSTGVGQQMKLEPRGPPGLALQLPSGFQPAMDGATRSSSYSKWFTKAQIQLLYYLANKKKPYSSSSTECVSCNWWDFNRHCVPNIAACQDLWGPTETGNHCPQVCGAFSSDPSGSVGCGTCSRWRNPPMFWKKIRVQYLE